MGSSEGAAVLHQIFELGQVYEFWRAIEAAKV